MNVGRTCCAVRAIATMLVGRCNQRHEINEEKKEEKKGRNKERKKRNKKKEEKKGRKKKKKKKGRKKKILTQEQCLQKNIC